MASYLDGDRGSDPLKMKDTVKRNLALSGKKTGPGSYFAKGASTFTQKSGPRAGQRYVVRRGASGLNERIYETGDTADQTKRKLGLGGRKAGYGS